MQAQEIETGELRQAVERREPLVAVHYACESFLTAKDHPAGVACVAIYDLITEDVLAFSRSDAPPNVEGEAREIDMLSRFFEVINSRPDAHVLHWNMNRPEYGFDALAARYRYLTEQQLSIAIPSVRRHDVDALLTARFGEDYAPHGKLESTGRLNGFDMRSFLAGQHEAERFAEQDWSSLTRSAASKAKIIGLVARLLVDGSIKTAGSAGQIPFAGGRLDAVAVVLELGARFLNVQRSLAKHPHGKAVFTFDDEYDDQYLYRALLTQFFEDVRDEEYSPSYAGGASRIDFLMPDFELAVELKHTRGGMTDKLLGEQLMIDKGRYSAHPRVTHLICLVFDHEGHLRNPRGLEKDLRQTHSSSALPVTVRIFDR